MLNTQHTQHTHTIHTHTHRETHTHNTHTHTHNSPGCIGMSGDECGSNSVEISPCFPCVTRHISADISHIQCAYAFDGARMHFIWSKPQENALHLVKTTRECTSSGLNHKRMHFIWSKPQENALHLV